VNLSRWSVGVGVAGALLVSVVGSCASAHPDFEQTFNSEYVGLEHALSPSHDAWMHLLATRYGCDTLPIRQAVRGDQDLLIGLSPCDIAGRNPPEAVRAWKTPQGLREEWRFGAGSRRTSVYLEGPREKELKTTFVQWS
jgi:hypothetical protein